MSNITLKNLETRASMAESLVASLRSEIDVLKSNFSGGSDYETEIRDLTAENQQLLADINEWKNKLIEAEIRNGKTQLASLQASEKIPLVSSSEKKVSKEIVPDIRRTNKNQPDKKAKKAEEKKGEQPKSSEAPVHVGRLDMRVGLIISAQKHPDADALYVEEVDVGEGKNRTVISGLVKFIPLEEMQNRKAILMCNLKPSKMRGIMSEAMVMCASTPDKVEILTPPDNSKPGDLVYVEGYERNPDQQLNPKKKVFENCAPDLQVNDKKIATYKGIPWTVNGEFCTSNSLLNVQIK